MDFSYCRMDETRKKPVQASQYRFVGHCELDFLVPTLILTTNYYLLPTSEKQSLDLISDCFKGDTCQRLLTDSSNYSDVAEATREATKKGGYLCVLDTLAEKYTKQFPEGKLNHR